MWLTVSREYNDASSVGKECKQDRKQRTSSVGIINNTYISGGQIRNHQSFFRQLGHKASVQSNIKENRNLNEK